MKEKLMKIKEIKHNPFNPTQIIAKFFCEECGEYKEMIFEKPL